MKHIYLNLKRFDIPAEFGGVNRLTPIPFWASSIVEGTQPALKEYDSQKVDFTIYFPEAHLPAALAARTTDSPLKIGCQSVYREDTAACGTFGGFTTSRPAAAMAAGGGDGGVGGEGRGKGK